MTVWAGCRTQPMLPRRTKARGDLLYPHSAQQGRRSCINTRLPMPGKVSQYSIAVDKHKRWRPRLKRPGDRSDRVVLSKEKEAALGTSPSALLSGRCRGTSFRPSRREAAHRAITPVPSHQGVGRRIGRCAVCPYHTQHPTDPCWKAILGARASCVRCPATSARQRESSSQRFSWSVACGLIGWHHAVTASCCTRAVPTGRRPEQNPGLTANITPRYSGNRH